MKIPPIPYHDLLRLEVETTPAGLPNLASNPSGEYGAWGWITPVGTQLITADATGLTFTATTTGSTSYWLSEYVPAPAAGRWMGARLDVVGFKDPTGGVFAYWNFYDANKTLLSWSPSSGIFTGTGTFYAASAQVPAGAAFVQLRLELLRANTYPTAGDWVKWRQAMITHAATAAEAGITRQNEVVNPSLEVNATGWQGNTAVSVARSTAVAAVSGTAVLAATVLTAQQSVGFDQPTTVQYRWNVTAGKDYRLSWSVRAATTGRAHYCRVVFYNASAAVVGTTSSSGSLVNTTAWVRRTHTFTAPAGATKAVVAFYIDAGTGATLPVGEVHYFDAFLLEQTDLAQPSGPYFDGSLVNGGGFTYGWNGTVHLSSSQVTAASYAYAEPITWRNILGPTHQIQIDRKALDVGTLSATIHDATLDPSTAAEIRPGKRVRLRVAHASFTGGWESCYEGRISTAKATYLRMDDGSEKVRVEVSAVDNIATLANQGEARGVATIADLPYLLEGRGVPWNVNGSGNQVTTATVVSSNDSASVLDQVAITRDTVLGQAFVDRNGVLVVRTTPTTVTDGFTDVPADYQAGKFSYSDIEIDFSTENLINEVTVTWLRYNSTTKETEEVTYGPYRDQASIDTWGVRSATFTIQGATENPATIATYAQSILTANAQPVVRPRRLVMPVKRTVDLVPATRYDLGHKVPVVRTGRLNASYVVQGITHTITPELWQVAYEFDPDGAVASPTMTPSPPAEAVVVNTSTTAFTPAAGYSATQQFFRQGRVVHVRMTITRTGAAVTLTGPDHTNQTLGTITDPAWRPVAQVASITYDGFRSVVIVPSGDVVTPSGMADTSYTSSTINTNNNITFGFCYLLPEGV